MADIVFWKEIMAIIGSTIALLIAIVGFIFWIARNQFRKGELYQMFRSLVQKVTSIEEMIEDKFIDNDEKHRKHTDQFQKHEKRITKLETINEIKKS